MKTISELEAELVEVQTEEAASWAKVQAARAEYDKLTTPWIALHNQKEKLSATIQIRKEMEAAQ